MASEGKYSLWKRRENEKELECMFVCVCVCVREDLSIYIYIYAYISYFIVYGEYFIRSDRIGRVNESHFLHLMLTSTSYVIEDSKNLLSVIKALFRLLKIISATNAVVFY